MGFNNLITKAVATVVPALRSQPDASVCELGNQTLKNSKARAELYDKLGISPPADINSTKEWYASLGFTRYIAIDVNTERDAVSMDLNLDLSRAYGFHEQFDLVTNNGTGEHVFNQYMVFKNAHDLCRTGGFMIHVLPFYRWVDHGFFNYNPNLFPCLAQANDYDLLQLWIGTNDAGRVEPLDTHDLARDKGLRNRYDLDSWKRDPSVVAVFQKTQSTGFRSPIQNMYGGDNITSAEIAGRYQ